MRLDELKIPDSAKLENATPEELEEIAATWKRASETGPLAGVLRMINQVNSLQNIVLSVPDFSKYAKHLDAALSALLTHTPDRPMPYSIGTRQLWELADATGESWREDAENNVKPVISFQDISDFMEAEKEKPGREFWPDADGNPDTENPIYTLAEVYAWIEKRRKKPSRPVPRVNSTTFDNKVRIPTVAPANGALTALMSPNGWLANEEGNAVFAQVRGTQVAIKCGNEIGFNPEKTIQRIAKHGPAMAQTFIAMVNLWVRENKGKDFETYMTGRASDLLRAQGRSDHNGGFPLDEQIEKGRQVFDLSMLTVPRTIETKYGRGKQQTRQTVAIGPLVIVQPIEVGPNDVPGEKGSMVTFRFHITRDIHDAICGDKGEYAELSSKMLTYHPIREKYHILLGFSLAYYDRVNRKRPRTHHPISLPALLSMACIEEPNTSPGRFLERLETAINDLSRDGVIPGLRLEKPKDWAEMLNAKKGRDVLNGSRVVFPRMIEAPEPAPEPAPARISSRNGAGQQGA